MTYLVLNLGMMTIAALATLLFTRPGRLDWPTLLLTMVVLLAMTAVFDSLIIAGGIVAYDESTLLGLRIWQAPIEDFSYALVAAFCGPLLFVRLARDRGGDRR
ncbi:MAG: lycopene cyclase domain-containing protein [Brooklawnia sp.]|uniref:lycopene cyclase domain-containing protein n=1 Tax=Brooklawnia sp. TaxID=2699740 RepID=UPI003C764026